jgi:hypothetical protein
VAAAGALALLLILFRTISTPIDTGGVSGIDVTRKIGLWIGLLAAAALTYGGWRAMQDGPAPLRGPTGGGTPASPTASTTAMPAGGGAAPAAPADPVPGSTAPQTPPGLVGDPPAEGGTTPPGV